MPYPEPIAIIGGGPAGALAAANLARAGLEVIVFDEKLAWEKPCGGGITHKALVEWPFLCDAQVERNWVSDCELISPSERRVSFHLDHPIAIFSRCVLNGLLLQKAREAGAKIVHDHVPGLERVAGRWQVQASTTRWDAAYVVIAAGARNHFRRQFSRPFASDDLMVTAGYYIPGQSQLMQIQFLAGLHGYIWIFPRADHFSVGICGKLSGQSTVELRRLLEEWMDKSGLKFANTRFFSHILPSLRAATLRDAAVSGEGWALIGDAAGFVDPITGEGLYYAMRSAELLSRALLAEQPESYSELLRNDFLPELQIAARVADRFYSGRWMGQAVIERMVQFTAHSPSFRGLMCDLFAGTQGYVDLRRRLYRSLPAMLAESLASALRLPGSEPGLETGTPLGDRPS
ncbi:MAG TPA: NAD(P)/FAD-dependent oxidoreductase [Terriglobales bacterium]|nr:NAD(P)/FAD-dependent oxidoreductase [Terriglobales bacterium]